MSKIIRMINENRTRTYITCGLVTSVVSLYNRKKEVIPSIETETEIKNKLNENEKYYQYEIRTEEGYEYTVKTRVKKNNTSEIFLHDMSKVYENSMIKGLLWPIFLLNKLTDLI